MRKKLNRIIVVCLTVFFVAQMIFLPVLVLAGSCKTESGCANDATAEKCGQNGGQYFSGNGCEEEKKLKIRLSVPIPGTSYEEAGQTYSLDIADYIGAMYVYALSIVVILAVLMIMAAGVTWAVAGGSPDKVNNAKSMISGAILGLLLALFSWTLLNTINPALTKLQVPRLPEIQRIETKICCLLKDGKTIKSMYGANECDEKNGEKKITCPEEIGEGSACFTIRDKEACEAACQGCKCTPVTKESLMSEAIKLHAIFVQGPLLASAAVAMAGGAVVASTAGQAVRALASFGYKLSWGLLKFAWKHPVLTGATTATIWVSSGDNDGEPGVCVAHTKNLPGGAICDPDEDNCASHTCIEINKLNGLGACSDGNDGDPCRQNSDCKGTNLECEQDDISGLSWCVDPLKPKQAGFSCSKNSDCQSNTCYNGICIAGEVGGPLCTSDNNCSAGYKCVNGSCILTTECQSNSDCAENYYCRYNQCIEKFELGASCGDDNECKSGDCNFLTDQCQ